MKVVRIARDMKIVMHFVNRFILPVLIFLAFGTAQVEAAPTLTLEDCQKCHKPEYQQITSQGRSHKEKVTCFDCHENHRPRVANNIPECSDCHASAPHEALVDCSTCHKRKKNCKACHQVHHPLARTDGKTALLHCKVCHPSEDKLLKASTSKHHKLSCGFCHLKHRAIKDCSGCHGRPHGEGTHKMFPKCGICHNIAHNLNRMPKK